MKTRWLLCFLLSACSPREVEDRFKLDRFAQAGRDDVFLNEKLVFKFSQPVDPSSINQENLTIFDRQGNRPPGHIQIGPEGREILFVPKAVLSRELDDGGYKPGETYEVRISGFPRSNVVRSMSGRGLGEGYRSSFRVLDPKTLPENRSSPFEDENTAQPFQERAVEPIIGQPLLIYFSKPVRPDTVRDEHFRLLENPNPMQRNSRLIPVKARLIENLDSATVALDIGEGAKLDVDYEIEVSELRDFSGRALQQGGRIDQLALFRFRFSAAPK